MKARQVDAVLAAMVLVGLAGLVLYTAITACIFWQWFAGQLYK